MFLRAAIVVASVRIALSVLPFRWVCGFVCGLPLSPDTQEGNPVNSLESIVRVVSRQIPMASCLTQALALRWLLVRAGHRARVHIGVTKSDTGGFEAHAWVESRGKILLGIKDEVNRFALILALPPQIP